MATKTQNFYDVRLLTVSHLAGGQYEVEFDTDEGIVKRKTRKNSYALAADLAQMFDASVNLIVDGRGSIITFTYDEEAVKKQDVPSFDNSIISAPETGTVHVYEDDGVVILTKQDWEDVQQAIGFYLGRRLAPPVAVAIRLEKMSLVPFVKVGVEQDA